MRSSGILGASRVSDMRCSNSAIAVSSFRAAGAERLSGAVKKGRELDTGVVLCLDNLLAFVGAPDATDHPDLPLWVIVPAMQTSLGRGYGM